MSINAFPTPRVSRFAAPAGPLSAWLRPIARGFYPSGTEALYWAFRGAGAGPGTTVWLPSFNCGVEIQAALDCGAEVGFFRTNLDLAHDLDDLTARLRARPGPVMLIHYFGFPQPQVEAIAALCRELHVPLIADCAHAMFTQVGSQWLHDQAPISIFSLHKFLGLYDGGALLYNEQDLSRYTPRPFDPPPPGRFFFRPYRHAMKSLARATVGEKLTGAYRRWRYPKTATNAPAQTSANATNTLGPNDTRDAHPMVPGSIRYGRRMSALSRRLLATADQTQIIAGRRAHYQQLDAALAGIPGYRPVFPTLPDGVCPLVLPIWVDHRAELTAQLAHAGIEPFIFGEYPHPGIDPAAYPNSARLRDHIMGLPIQQDLTPAQLERLITTLRPLLPKRALAS